MNMRKRIGVVAVVGLIATLAVPAVASAGLLFTGTADTCDTDPTQAFQQWGDTASYALVGGGAFESGDPGWTLSGGAKLASGNEPYYLEGRGDSRSLLVPAGGTALSPTSCFAFGDWHLRFVARNAGTTKGSLQVDVVVRSLLGILSVLDGGTVSPSGTWAPSSRVSALVSNLGGLLPTRAVAVRLHATGTAYQVDDVYLDPWKSN
jgi:hypothetical protein